MKKHFAIFAILATILLVTTVLANNSTSFNELDSDIKEFVKDVAQKKGIEENSILDINKVELDELPNEVKLENIDETNLALYEIEIENSDKPVFVLTVSEETFTETIKQFTRKMMINYGHSGKLTESSFLKTSTGVISSEEKGYVMMRDGSITGLSTNLEAIEGVGEIEIIIYKNSKEIGFRNTIAIESEGIKKDYDTQSENTVQFESGDIISIYAKINGDIQIKDITTLIEISTLE
jgi:hypothetical protein